MEYALKYQQHLKGLIISNMSDLGKISVPTLVIGARYDTMNPAT